MHDTPPDTVPPAPTVVPAHPVVSAPPSGQLYPWAGADAAPYAGAPAGPAGFVPAPQPAIAGRPSNAYRGLTIAAFVLSVLSFLGVLAIFAFVALAFWTSGPGGSMAPLTGQVTVAAGQALPGDDLANAVEQRIVDDGASNVALTCPATPKVDQGVVTVCHGDIDDTEWAVVVYFEDNLGAFTLNPI
jgi:Domain of unknown function (DUF4333)